MMTREKHPPRAMPASFVDGIFDEEEPQQKQDDSDFIFLRPKNIGRYRVLDELGRGGMGKVYLVYDPHLKRQMALKIVLQKPGERERQRFLREAKVMASLEHPHIAKIYEFSVIDDMPYLVMDYIKGLPLLQFISAKSPPLHMRLQIMVCVAEAIDYAHRRGVFHRDIKPSNIIINNDNIPYVLDFGLAKTTDVPDKSITKTGEILGTPQYMSPEQAKGQLQEFDRCSETYSLGVVLYEILSGIPVVQGDNLMNIICQVIRQSPRPIRELVPDIPSRLEAICHKALEKDKKKRYSSARRLARDLQAYCGNRAISLPQMPAKTNSQKKFWVPGIATLLFLIVGQAFFFIGFSSASETNVGNNRELESSYHPEDAYLGHAETQLQKARQNSAEKKWRTVKKNYRLAEESCRKALAISPDHPRARRLLSTIHLYRGNLFHHNRLGKKHFSHAEAEYNRSLELEDNPLVYYYRGNLYWLAIVGDLKLFSQYGTKAIADFSRAIEKNQKSADVYYRRGYLYSIQAELDKTKKSEYLDKSLADHTRSIELSSKISHKAMYLCLRGTLYQNSFGDSAKAEQDFKAALEIDPSYLDAYYKLGHLYANTNPKRRKKALDTYSQAIAVSVEKELKSSTLAQIYVSRAKLYHEHFFQYDKALVDYNEALAITEIGDAYLGRGDLHLHSKNYEAAKTDLDKAIEFLPVYGKAYLRRGEYYFLRKNYEKSEQDYLKAKELKEGRAYLQLIRLYQVTKQSEKFNKISKEMLYLRDKK